MAVRLVAMPSLSCGRSYRALQNHDASKERHTGSQVNKRMVAEGDSRSGGVHKGDAVCRVTQGPVKQTRRLRHGELPNFTPQERLTLNLLPKMDTPAAAFRGPSWLVPGLV